MRSAFSGICPVTLVPSGGVTARLGSVTELDQHFLQKLTPPLDNVQNEVVAVSVSRRQMPRIHQAIDVAFGSPPCFEQCFTGCAFVDVFSNELPSLFLAVPNRVVGKFRCVDQGVEIGMCVRCVQSGLSQQLRLCRRLSCAHYIACCWLVFVGAGAKGRLQ